MWFMYTWKKIKKLQQIQVIVHFKYVLIGLGHGLLLGSEPAEGAEDPLGSRVCARRRMALLFATMTFPATAPSSPDWWYVIASSAMALPTVSTGIPLTTSTMREKGVTVNCIHRSYGEGRLPQQHSRASLSPNFRWAAPRSSTSGLKIERYGKPSSLAASSSWMRGRHYMYTATTATVPLKRYSYMLAHVEKRWSRPPRGFGTPNFAHKLILQRLTHWRRVFSSSMRASSIFHIWRHSLTRSVFVIGKNSPLQSGKRGIESTFQNRSSSENHRPSFIEVCS